MKVGKHRKTVTTKSWFQWFILIEFGNTVLSSSSCVRSVVDESLFVEKTRS
jgi:hypothetical protein